MCHCKSEIEMESMRSFSRAGFGRISPFLDELYHFCAQAVFEYIYIIKCRRTTAVSRWDKPRSRQADCEDKMCLGVPGKIVEIYEKGGLKMAKVDFGGIFREACLDYVPEAKTGDYCVIHVGFAISLLNEKEALETLDLLKQITDVEKEIGPG